MSLHFVKRWGQYSEVFIVSSAGDIEEAGIVANVKALINLCRRFILQLSMK